MNTEQADGLQVEQSSWKLAHPLNWRVFHCQCGRPVFFRNSRCLHCATPLAYEPGMGMLVPLEAMQGEDNLWLVVGDAADGIRYRRCGNFALAARCNWLVVDDPSGNPLCRCCRLNRIVPDQEIESNQLLWNKVEISKRRLVSSLITLGLPVASRVSEDPERGLAFDLLVAQPGDPPVLTGHRDGIITLNVNEADDGTREAMRLAMREPYRTVLGHLRHESGHYYWTRLVEGSSWHEPFRSVFGDERDDYNQALNNHYMQGPPPSWTDSYVSAYASSHPWEDWAETWAHYLHMIDTLDTALSAGIDGAKSDLVQDPFDESVLYGAGAPEESDQHFLAFVNSWIELTSILNELSRSMGLPDFYPFVLSRAAVNKLHFVHRFIREHQRDMASTQEVVQKLAADQANGAGVDQPVLESVAGEEDPGAALDLPSPPAQEQVQAP